MGVYLVLYSEKITLQIMSFEVESQHENASADRRLLSTRDLHDLKHLQRQLMHLHLLQDLIEHHLYLSMPSPG